MLETVKQLKADPDYVFSYFSVTKPKPKAEETKEEAKEAEELFPDKEEGD